jgi:nucleoside-diphosphate-sugar epimerase
MKKILLTGATGFVGRHVLARLNEAGCAIRAVSRRDVPSVNDTVRTDDLFTESFDFWERAFVDVEQVIHCAWYVEPGEYLNSQKNFICMEGTLQMAKAAAKAGVKRFVGIGTCLEYEPTQGYLSTTSPLKPNSGYGLAKVQTYLALSKLMKQESVSFAWCRLFYLFGEGEDKRRLVAYIRERLSRGEVAELSSSEPIRDYLDVSEASRLITKLSLSDLQGAFNICSGQPVTIGELAIRIADEYGRRDLLNFGSRADNGNNPPCILGVPSKIE